MSYPIQYVYHSHTKRCGHAQGEDEEYVLSAIKAGIKVLCFTDHVCFPHFHHQGIRMDYEQIDEYISAINALKKKYENAIEIHLGFEAEYYPENKDYLRFLLEEKGIEFLILGEHGYMIDNQWYFANRVYPNDIKKTTELYLKNVTEAMESGLFKYFAHPDLFMNNFIETNEFTEKIARSIIETAIKNDIILEMNRQGLANKNPLFHHYPDPDFWRIVNEYPEAKVILGVDAHNPHVFEEDDPLTIELLKMAKDLKIQNIVTQVKLWK